MIKKPSKLEKAYLGISIHIDSACEFRSKYAMSGGASATREGEERPTTPIRGEEDEEYDSQAECRVRKKRATSKQRVWIEYGRWDREDWSQEDIDKRYAAY